jgi:DNA replication ATP-dependent helicase Dna2
MDGKGWIMSLPPNADKVHALPAHPIDLKSPHGPGKRVAAKMEEDKGPAGKENERIPRPVKKMKKPRVDTGILRGRPILQDVVNGEK